VTTQDDRSTADAARSGRPLAITLIGWVFIVVGCAGLVSQFLPGEPRAAGALLPPDAWYVLVSGAIALATGALLLAGFGWARWLVVGRTCGSASGAGPSSWWVTPCCSC
jgi:hypothetical protein